jgi:lipid-A-disaccharide synthase
MEKFKLDDARPVIGLFPGSRRSEIKGLFPVILDSARLLKEHYPAAQFVLPLASSLKQEELQPAIDASGLDITLVANATHDVIQVCDAIITVSGTVTMEIAILGVPMVIIYKVSPFTYAVGKRLIKVDHIGICNIVAGARVVKELIQHEAEPDNIAAEIAAILDDQTYAERIREDLATIPAKLGSGGALQRVAQLALRLIN